MRKKSYQKMVEERISSMPAGTPFVTSDFCDLADADTVSKALLRLIDAKTIVRVLRGVYVKNVDVAPSVDSIAHAIARGNSWRIAPSGDTALYLAGLTDNRPSVWTYVANGTYREYTVGEETIRFLRTTGKLFPMVSEKTALVIQVLKYYGKEKISDDHLRLLSRKFCHGNEELLLRETERMSEWIVKCIRRMCRIRT